MRQGDNRKARSPRHTGPCAFGRPPNAAHASETDVALFKSFPSPAGDAPNAQAASADVLTASLNFDMSYLGMPIYAA